MNDINNFFFELIRVAIGYAVCLSHTPTIKEWQMLYEMAKKQSLAGICFAGVQKLTINHSSLIVNLSESLRLQWMGMAAKIQQRNEVLNRQCAELQAKLSGCGMRSSILKGQGIAALYSLNSQPSSLNLLRQSGDIDIYVDCGREKAIEYARSMQDVVDWDYKHLRLKVFKDTEVEMHYRPEILMNLRKNARLQRWFEQPEVQRAMFQVSGNLVTPSVEFNLFYILLHIYRHFLFEGVGLRQLMDYYFVLRTYGTEGTESGEGTSSGHSLPSILSLLQTFGMMRFARGVMWIMLYVFEGGKSLNSHPSSLNLQIEPDEKEGRYILREVMEGGNFGHHNERLRGNGKDSKTKNWKREDMKRRLRHSLHLLGHYPDEVIWSPIYMLWHFCWKRLNANR